jgi:hypothetical protein
MAATLTLVETGNRLTYTGIGLMTGYSLVVYKDANRVRIEQTIPVAISGGETWQTVRDKLASRLV